MEIIKNYLTNNRCYTNNTKKSKTGYMQHSTGTPGAKASSFLNSWNKQSATVGVEFIIDDTGIYQCLPIGIRSWHGGGSSNNTHVGCEICEPEATRFLDACWLVLSKDGSNNTTYAVTAVQKELDARGYDVNGIDGIFGTGLQSAIKQFQKDNGLTQDGKVGKATLHKLQDREGSYVKYNAKENKEYFEDIYNKAVYTAAYVLKELGVSASKITSKNLLCHSEGYKLGIATNHADVMHWFPEHGKTMDDFRSDVKDYMTSGVLPYGDEETGVAGDNEGYKTYIVKSGDSWWSIAQSQLGNGSEYKALMEYNGKTSSDVLQPGDIIRIPVDTAEVEEPVVDEPQKGENENPSKNEKPSTSTDLPRGEPPVAADDWAQEAWVKLYNKYATDGTDPKGVVTTQRLAVILNALGLLD